MCLGETCWKTISTSYKWLHSKCGVKHQQSMVFPWQIQGKNDWLTWGWACPHWSLGLTCNFGEVSMRQSAAQIRNSHVNVILEVPEFQIVNLEESKKKRQILPTWSPNVHGQFSPRNDQTSWPHPFLLWSLMPCCCKETVLKEKEVEGGYPWFFRFCCAWTQLSQES